MSKEKKQLTEVEAAVKVAKLLSGFTPEQRDRILKFVKGE